MPGLCVTFCKDTRMLVLSRKLGEKLVIGDNIEIEIVKFAGNRVTLGIVAPRSVQVLRGEVLDRLTLGDSELDDGSTDVDG